MVSVGCEETTLSLPASAPDERLAMGSHGVESAVEQSPADSWEQALDIADPCDRFLRLSKVGREWFRDSCACLRGGVWDFDCRCRQDLGGMDVDKSREGA